MCNYWWYYKTCKKQKKVSDKSIKFYLNNNDNFIHIWEWIYWLASNREWKPVLQKSISESKNVVDIVEDFLEETDDKSATIDDIIKHVKKQKKVSETYIVNIVWDKQKNKNKFTFFIFFVSQIIFYGCLWDCFNTFYMFYDIINSCIFIFSSF